MDAIDKDLSQIRIFNTTNLVDNSTVITGNEEISDEIINRIYFPTLNITSEAKMTFDSCLETSGEQKIR
jgi:hypothetical protein